MGNIPYIKGSLLFGIISKFGKDPLHYYLETSKLGDIVKLNMGVAGTGYFLSHPDYVYHVLHGNQKNYVKSALYKKMASILGNGLLLSEGSFWMRQRRLIQPSFRRKKIEQNFIKIMIDNTAQMLDDWQPFVKSQKPVNICVEMSHLTLRIVLKSLFEASIEEDVLNFTKSWEKVNTELGRRFWLLFDRPSWFPTASNKEYHRNIEFLNQFIYKFIEREKKQPGENLLSSFLQIEDEDTGEKMTEKQIRDELMTLFLAGHETSSNALAWTIYLLLQNDYVIERLYNEIDNFSTQDISIEAIEKMSYNKMVLEETMRLYTPVWALSRNALDNDTIGDVNISKGNFLFMSQYAMHRNPAYWEKPLEFYPEHFAPDQVETRPRYVYFPFGGGGRVCIGNHFAMIEMQVILAMILQRYRLKAVHSKSIKELPLTTLTPQEDILVLLENR